MFIEQSGIKKKVFIFLSILVGITASLYIYNTYFSAREGIHAYEPVRDRAFVLQLFKDNWDWLVSRYSTDFSAEYALDNRASSKKPEHKNNLIMQVSYHNNQPTGFVAYYQKAFYEGFILFLVVAQQFRSQGFARRLLRYAIDDLKARGSTVIRLITLVKNKSARKVYEGMGFKQYWTDGEFIRYEKYI